MKDNASKIFITTLVIFAGVLFTIYRHWELGGESWGYWTFAQIFQDSGKFVILDRSPLYILYLNAFLWLGYPVSVISEFIATSFILAISMVFLIRPYTGLLIAVFVTLLWLPLFQHIMPPPVQQFALASSCWAVIVRRNQTTRFQSSLSYALLGIAYFFRPTYIILVFVFLIWDISSIVKQNGFRELMSLARPRWAYWPIGLIFIGLIWFTTMQSQHRWNGPTFSNTRTGTSLASASFLQEYTEEYTKEKIQEGDINITKKLNLQQEVFGDSETILEAFVTNPVFVMRVMIRNLKKLFSPNIGTVSNLGLIGSILNPILFIMIILGAFISTKDKNIKLLIISNVLLLMVTILSEPKWRYNVPLFPILILGIWYYCKQTSVIIIRYLSKYINIKSLVLSNYLIIILLLLLFSNNAWNQKSSWTHIISDFVNDVKQHDVRVLEIHSINANTTSMKASFGQLDTLISECNGVLSLEYLFLSAFMIPQDRVFSMWISDYSSKQLQPEYIDCVLLSNQLMHEVSLHSTFHSTLTYNYNNYIKPYVDRLKKLGAETYKIPNYGEVVIIQRNKTKLVP